MPKRPITVRQRSIKTAGQVKPVSRDDLLWLAGWWEGEGCFTGGDRPVMTACSTDRDTMERVADLLDTTSRGPYFQEESEKGIYKMSISGTRARVWMLRLYPYMGTRRRAKIREMFGSMATDEGLIELSRSMGIGEQ